MTATRQATAAEAPLRVAAEQFASARPWLTDPEAVRDRCAEVAFGFAEALDGLFDARIVWFHESPFPDVEVGFPQRQHAVVTTSATPGVYVDLSYRQFDPDSPVPRLWGEGHGGLPGWAATVVEAP